MATVLDVSLLERFGAIFPFLFVMVFSFAILSTIKIFGDRKGLDALVSLLLAILVLFSNTARLTINMMAPWFVLFFFFLIFLVIALMIFGVTQSDLLGAVKGNRTIIIWILAIALMIWLGSMTTVISQQGGIGGSSTTTTVVNQTTGEVTTTNQQSAFWSTITNPKVLGLALILLIATFTVQRLSSSI